MFVMSAISQLHVHNTIKRNVQTPAYTLVVKIQSYMMSIYNYPNWVDFVSTMYVNWFIWLSNHCDW